MNDKITVDLDVKMRPCDFLTYVADCRFILSVVGSSLNHDSVKVWDTRRGHHISLTTPVPFVDCDIVRLQLFLGSDRKREAFNDRRINNGNFRSYLFDAKITKDGSFVNERNKMFEDIWKSVFQLSEEEFTEKYKLFQKNKYEGKQNGNLAQGNLGPI